MLLRSKAAAQKGARATNLTSSSSSGARRHAPLRLGLFVKAAKRDGEQPSQSPSPDYLRVLPRMAVCGAVMGTLLDGMHSRVGLQIYDLAPLTIGPLQTSALVPPLLAVWYAVTAALVLAGDAAWPPSKPRPQRRVFEASATGVAAAYGLLAANLALSAELYASGAPYAGVIAPTLAATTVLMWWLLDGTWHIAVLAAVTAVGAPLAEVVLMANLSTWHYARPDVTLFNAACFVSWVPFCYAGYVPLLASLTRYAASSGSVAEERR